MKHAPATLGGAALLWLLTFGSDARADLIQWSYNWSRSPDEVFADSPGTGKITLTDEGLRDAIGSSDIVATNIRAYSSASPETPDNFTAKPYALALYLLDHASGVSSTLTFSGQFDGTLSALSSNIKNTFTNAVTQSIVLGNDRYTATIGAYTPPGPTGASTTGSISAHATVTVEAIIRDVPEPGTLTLAALALPVLGAAAWRRRQSIIR